MQQSELKVLMRPAVGRTQVKKLRRTGFVPAVLYGPHTQPIALQVAQKALGSLVHRSSQKNQFVELQLDENGKIAKRLALIQEVQQNPVTDELLHVDFREISLTEKLTTIVSVEARGEAIGVHEGGVLNCVLHQLTVRCLPKDLPDRIEVDVTKLAIGQNIQIGDIATPSGVEIVAADKTAAVFAVVAPMAEEEVAPAAETAEPEVIKAKKAEGEEEAPAAPTAATKGAPSKAGEVKAEAKPEAKGKGEAGKTATTGKAEAKPTAAKPAAGKPSAPQKSK